MLGRTICPSLVNKHFKIEANVCDAFEETKKITKYTNKQTKMIFSIICPSEMPPSLVMNMLSISSLR
jgi:hypothetical protein